MEKHIALAVFILALMAFRLGGSPSADSEKEQRFQAINASTIGLVAANHLGR
jgi:hypothetical protein